MQHHIPLMPLPDMQRHNHNTMYDPAPRVFMDLSIDGSPPNRIEIILFVPQAPKAAERFRALCTGEMGIGRTTGKPLHYKGTVFHHIFTDRFAQGGDIENNDGTGGESISGNFNEKNWMKMNHIRRGLLSTAPSTGSQFSILMTCIPEFDGLHIVFGAVVKGMKVLDKINRLGTRSGTPTGIVKITDCGEIRVPKFNFSRDFLNSVPVFTKPKRGKKCNSVSKFSCFKEKGEAHHQRESQFYFYPLEETPKDMKRIAEKGDEVRYTIAATGRRPKFASEFYSYKSKYSSSNFVSDNYLSRGIEVELFSDFLGGKKEITRKKARSSYESADGREKEGRNGSTFGDENKNSLSESCKFGGKRLTFSDDGQETEWYKSDSEFLSSDLGACDLEFYSSD